MRSRTHTRDIYCSISRRSDESLSFFPERFCWNNQRVVIKWILNGLYQSMAIILIHMRRLLLLFTTIYLSSVLLRRLFYGRLLGENAQKLNLKLTKKNSAHMINWCYLYAIYSYAIILVVINWSDLLRLSFSLIWESPILSSSTRIFVTHIDSNGRDWFTF